MTAQSIDNPSKETDLLRQEIAEKNDILSRMQQQLVSTAQQLNREKLVNETLIEQRSELMDQITELSVALKITNKNAQNAETQQTAKEVELQNLSKTLQDTVCKVSGIAEEAKHKFRCAGWYVELLNRVSDHKFLSVIPWLTSIADIVKYHDLLKAKDKRLLTATLSSFDEDYTESTLLMFTDAFSVFENLSNLSIFKLFTSKTNVTLPPYLDVKSNTATTNEEEVVPKSKRKKAKTILDEIDETLTTTSESISRKESQ